MYPTPINPLRKSIDDICKRQGDHIHTDQLTGGYQHCFRNDMSTLSEKVVGFDTAVESAPRKETLMKPG